MLKKTMFFSAFLLLLIPAVSFSQIDKYAEAKIVINELAVITDECAVSFDKAQTGVEAAAALNKYKTGLMKLIPKIKDLEKKFPELKNAESPEELKVHTEKIIASSGRLAAVFSSPKGTKMLQEPEVMQAIQDLQKSMSFFTDADSAPEPVVEEKSVEKPAAPAVEKIKPETEKKVKPEKK